MSDRLEDSNTNLCDCFNCSLERNYQSMRKHFYEIEAKEEARREQGHRRFLRELAVITGLDSIEGLLRLPKEAELKLKGEKETI